MIPSGTGWRASRRGKESVLSKGDFLEQLLDTKFYPDAKREKKGHLHFPSRIHVLVEE